LTIIGYAFLIAVVGNFVLSKLRQFSAGATAQPRDPPQQEVYITEDHAKAIATQANLLIFHARCVIESEDPKFVGKIAAFCFFLTLVTKFFSGASLLYLVFLGVFVSPIIHEKYRTEIDAFLEKASAASCEFVNRAQKEVKGKISQIKQEKQDKQDKKQ